MWDLVRASRDLDIEMPSPRPATRAGHLAVRVKGSRQQVLDVIAIDVVRQSTITNDLDEHVAIIG